jgi:hypothetical protein
MYLYLLRQLQVKHHYTVLEHFDCHYTGYILFLASASLQWNFAPRRTYFLGNLASSL